MNRAALLGQVHAAALAGNWALLMRIAVFLGSDQFRALMELLAGWLKPGASVMAIDESRLDDSGVNFMALEAILSGNESSVATVRPLANGILDLAAERLGANYAGLVGDGVGVLAIDIGGIFKLVELVMGLIKNCPAAQKPTPASAAGIVRDAQRDGILFRFGVTRRLKQIVLEDRGRDGWRELRGDGIVDTVIRTAAESTPEELHAFMVQVQSA